MANVPPIPPATGCRPPIPTRAAERPPTPARTPFQAHLARAKGFVVPGMATGGRGEPARPRRPDGPPGAAVTENPPSELEGRTRRVAAERDGREDDPTGGSRRDLDPLDPMARALYGDGAQRLAFEHAAAVATKAAPQASQPDPALLAARVSLEHVMSRFVRRVAWSGDASTGTARLELGAGALSGATLTIHSERGEVRVALELPPGVDGAEWRERIARRLGARGLQVAALDVE